jgi:hypothetical protein
MLHFGRELREEGSTQRERGEKERKKPRLQTPTHTKRKEKKDDINNTI